MGRFSGGVAVHNLDVCHFKRGMEHRREGSLRLLDCARILFQRKRRHNHFDSVGFELIK
jgi:hypothetical protein